MEEIDILNAIHGFCQCTVMDYASLACEYIFKMDIIWGIAALFLLRRPNTRIIGLTLIVALILNACVCYPLKIVIDRPRPFEIYDVDAMLTSFATGSFPSSHTAGAFCAATVIFVFDKYKGAWLFLLALFVGLTRMYLYVHFPTDVAVGAAIGIVSAMIVFFTLHRMEPNTVFVECIEAE